MPNIPVTSGAGNQVIPLGQIQFDRSITPGAVPGAASLEEGSIAINLADRKLFTKDQNGQVISLGRDYTADIANAQTNAVSTANAYTDATRTAMEGGTLDASLDTILKLGNRLKDAEADILAGAAATSALTKADVGLSNVENYGISDSVTDDVSTQYASSKAVKTAFDRAVSGEAAAKAYADAVKSDLLGGAVPDALDTLSELASQLQDDGSAITAINTNLATKAAKTYVDDELAKKVNLTQMSDAIDLDDSTKVATSKAVKDSLDAAKAYADAGLALKVDIASISDAIDSQATDKVASSKAVDDARQQAINHANSMVLGLAANMDYGRTF